MNKLIIKIIFIILFFLLISPVKAQENIADGSGTLAYNLISEDKSNNLFIKKLAIRKVLEKYSSPLSDSVDSFIDSCITYDLDCYLLPSISGLESTFGRFIYPDSFNPFGWGSGYIMFSNWSHGINTVGKGLRVNYINRGAKTVEEIGQIYSESPTWAVRVQHLINQFQKEEEHLRLYSEKNSVEL